MTKMDYLKLLVDEFILPQLQQSAQTDILRQES